jgi:hypothetical protein
MLEKGQKGATRKRGLYTPPAKQTRVIAASLARKSNREISRQEGMKRDTVARILSRPDVQELLAGYRQQARGLVPHCLAALEAKLITKAGKPRKSIDWRMIVEILKGTQVFVGKQEQEVHEKKDEFDGRSRDELKFCLENGRFPDADSSEQVSGEETPDGTGASRTMPN